MLRFGRVVFLTQKTLKCGEINQRLLATAPQVATKHQEEPKAKKGAKESKSFTMNIFRGTVEASQVFPYPDVLTAEQRDTLTLLVDPTVKFFQVM
ncbi:hypothetical protein J437_LFUL007964, partial [Ladona fulva]